MNKKVGVIGHLGMKKNFCDGQTVKTKNLVDLLENVGGFSVFRVDTHLFKVNKIKLMLDSLHCLLTCKHIFLLVSTNGMRFYLPFLYYVNKLTKRKIYHYIIGSELLDMVDRDASLVKYLNGLTANWFEYERGTQFLRSKGVKNASTLTNFKMIQPVTEAYPYENADGVYRFCTFSRVMEEKGITDAITAIADINAQYGRKIATLDVYGPVAPDYSQTFDRLLQENKEHTQYKGIINSANSVESLKDYYALLFPTRWAGEGVPGTIIDAFASGLPVIATDWNANSSLIQNGKQGIIYPSMDLNSLKEAVIWGIQNRDAMNKMRFDSREEYNRYTPDAVFRVIKTEMENV